MEFLKHKAGVLVLILSLVIIVSVVWYLLFGMQGGGTYEGGTLVNGNRTWESAAVCDGEQMTSITRVLQDGTVGL